MGPQEEGRGEEGRGEGETEWGLRIGKESCTNGPRLIS